MQESGVHVYEWVNDEGRAGLARYHREPVQGIILIINDLKISFSI